MALRTDGSGPGGNGRERASSKLGLAELQSRNDRRGVTVCAEEPGQFLSRVILSCELVHTSAGHKSVDNIERPTKEHHGNKVLSRFRARLIVTRVAVTTIGVGAANEVTHQVYVPLAAMRSERVGRQIILALHPETSVVTLVVTSIRPRRLLLSAPRYAEARNHAVWNQQRRVPASPLIRTSSRNHQRLMVICA
jgi:hypothetical protein